MKRWLPVSIGIIGLLWAPAAHAEPAVPQADTACPAALGGALTQSADATTLLECAGGPTAAYRWRIYDDPYPHSDRWLTVGPALTLDGEAQRSREVDSGDWTGYPQGPQDRCTARQVAVAAAGGAGPPEVASGEPGAP